MSLKNDLLEWTDWDSAEYELAQALGIIGEGVEFLDVKGIFWSNNPIGNALHKILDELVESGFLEKRDEPDFQYRYNQAFPID